MFATETFGSWTPDRSNRKQVRERLPFPASGRQAPTSYNPEEALSVVGEGFEMAFPETPDWLVVLKTVPRRMVRSFGEKWVLQAL
jgi:hypothetical protein